MDSTINGSKSIFAMIIGVFAYLLDCITELVIILGILMIIDYITGVVAAAIQGKLSSKKSIIGALRKLGLIIILALAFCLDYIIFYLALKIGFDTPSFGIFALATNCWLIGTEGISILENLSRWGIHFPKFLEKAFEKLVKSSDDISKL